MLLGLKSRDTRLVTDLLHALKKLLETDDYFGIQGSTGSVYQALVTSNIQAYLQGLNQDHQNIVFEAAQEFNALFMKFDDEFGDLDCILEMPINPSPPSIK